jgi:methyl-accepting chemotaxis protein
MDDELTGNDMEAWLRQPVESPSDAPGAEGSLPQDTPLDDEQSPEPQEEVAPDPVGEEPESAEQESDAVSPEADASAEPPVATQPAWDSPENPYFQQMEELKRLAAEQRAEQARKEAITAENERFSKALKGIATEVDESDIDALAGDLIAEIRESAAEPFQEQMGQITHSFTSLVAAVKELPAETQEFLKSRSKYWGEVGSTTEAVEQAFTVQSQAKQEFQKELAKMQQQVNALKGELKKQATKATGADRADVAVVGASGAQTDNYTSMEDYLRGADDAGRRLLDPYGARRTG